MWDEELTQYVYVYVDAFSWLLILIELYLWYRCGIIKRILRWSSSIEKKNHRESKRKLQSEAEFKFTVISHRSRHELSDCSLFVINKKKSI